MFAVNLKPQINDFVVGERGQCQPVIFNYRGGSGGSGAGGSVVIVTNELIGNISSKIDVQGGPALSLSVDKCGNGPGYGM